jgi:transcription elongation GreA/GreB family factor
MSRAFIKENDSDLPDDLPELPLSGHPNYVTPPGLAQLRQRLTDGEARLAAIDTEAAGVRLEKAMIERELRWLQSRIADAIPVVNDRKSQERVAFGATVEMADQENHRLRYRIVGEDEADPEHGSISWVSPLARALNGARVGDSVIWKRPAGDLEVEILGIDYR